MSGIDEIRNDMRPFPSFVQVRSQGMKKREENTHQMGDI
jgi:hypothetical protein